MAFDNQSPPGAWVREWDRQSHAITDYQREIQELRSRIRAYLLRIEGLERELHEERSRNQDWIREP